VELCIRVVTWPWQATCPQVLVWIVITITVLVIRAGYNMPGAVPWILGAGLAAIRAAGAQVPGVVSGADVEQLPGR
jgi:hypothetical protein